MVTPMAAASRFWNVRLTLKPWKRSSKVDKLFSSL
jgi:hypothetical protein